MLLSLGIGIELVNLSKVTPPQQIDKQQEKNVGQCKKCNKNSMTESINVMN